MASITLSEPVPSTVTASRASRIGGSESSTSARRIRIWSAQRPPSAAARPSRVPPVMANAVAPRPSSRDGRAPCRTRANRSRPSWSVPNQCAAPGGVSASAGWVSMGEAELSRPGASAATSSRASAARARRRASGGRRRAGAAGAGTSGALRSTASGAASGPGTGSTVVWAMAVQSVLSRGSMTR